MAINIGEELTTPLTLPILAYRHTLSRLITVSRSDETGNKRKGRIEGKDTRSITLYTKLLTNKAAFTIMISYSARQRIE